MASCTSFLTLAKPLALPNNTTSLPSNHSQLGFRRNTTKVNAVSLKWEPTKVVPQANLVLVRLEELPEKSAGGVLLPKSAVKFEKYLMGEVLSIGSDVYEVETGKKVLFSDINAYEVDLGTETKHCFVKEADLLAVVE